MSWNFALILFLLLVLTGGIWLVDRIWLRSRRRARIAEAVARAELETAGASPEHVAERRQQAAQEAGRMSWWLEYAVSFFPVILFVFLLRSFVVEPFRIPSGSMLPTLESGDLILVNKFSYGIRLPVLDRKVIDTGSPKRGDIMVFRYPVEPQVDYVKRVIGLPGDQIAYLDKKLYLNGQEVARARDGDYFEPDRVSYTAKFDEKIGDVEHKILVDERSFQDIGPTWTYPNRQNCQYERNGIRCTVPEGQYFVMGDNRDNSLDSRYWGFVPDANIVGKTFMIWMNFGDLGRIGRVH
ncbi:Signal peptidase I [plant metagenome]|uniref:signal peptidase I n=1 Tax=plant metagenome TaxID=1297885 RepID=A0A484VEQ8_9ZZZZ